MLFTLGVIEVEDINTKLQSAIMGDGAEYFVASQLMLNLKLLVSLAPTSAPSWDLEVTDPITNKTAKIQVKYRTRYNGDGGHLRLRGGTGFDFLILVENPISANLEFLESDVKSKRLSGLQGSMQQIYLIGKL